MNIVVQIIGITFPILAIVALGTLLGRYLNLEMETANRLNLDVFVPALVFSAFSDKSFALTEHLSLAIAGLVIVIVAGVIAFFISIIRKTTADIPSIFNHESTSIGLL